MIGYTNHRNSRIVIVALACVVFAVAGLAVGTAGAAPVYAPQREGIDLASLVGQFMALAGVGALVAFIVNALKQFGVVKDGDAPTWSTGINLLGLVTLFVLRVFVPQADVGQLDGLAATLAQIGVLVLGLVTQLAASRATHYVARGAFVIGSSHTLNEIKRFAGKRG